MRVVMDLPDPTWFELAQLAEEREIEVPWLIAHAIRDLLGTEHTRLAVARARRERVVALARQGMTDVAICVGGLLVPRTENSMTDRIDHVAEALRLADLSQHPDTGDPAVGALYIGAAQVHAKLALAEQQRVANLIALWKDDDDAVTLSQAGFSFPATLEEILAGLVR